MIQMAHLFKRDKNVSRFTKMGHAFPRLSKGMMYAICIEKNAYKGGEQNES